MQTLAKQNPPPQKTIDLDMASQAAAPNTVPTKATPVDPNSAIGLAIRISIWLLAAILAVVVVLLFDSRPWTALLILAIALPAYAVTATVSLVAYLSGGRLAPWAKLATLLGTAAGVAPLAVVLVALLAALSFVIAIFQACGITVSLGPAIAGPMFPPTA